MAYQVLHVHQPSNVRDGSVRLQWLEEEMSKYHIQHMKERYNYSDQQIRDALRQLHDAGESLTVHNILTTIMGLAPTGVFKKLEAAGKKKSSEVFSIWSRSISNHIYWCAMSSNGDGQLLLEKWLSILNHVRDIHEGHGERFPACQHEILEDRAWIKSGSKGYTELEKVIRSRLLLTDIQKLSPAEQTSGLEAFHKVICHFAPKLVHYFHAQMEARVYLAGLHFNENSSRKQATNSSGEPIFSVSYPKGRNGQGVAKEVKVQQTYEQLERDVEFRTQEINRLVEGFADIQRQFDFFMQQMNEAAQRARRAAYYQHILIFAAFAIMVLW